MGNCDKASKTFEMTAVCGIYCAECECHTAKDNPKLMDYLVNSAGIKAERLPCEGCRAVEGDCPVLGEKCRTYQCAKDKNVDFCCDCADFPCEMLTPASDRANILPHNLKVYNLCCIQRQGLEKFAEKAAGIKQRYFKGKMIVGRGPQL